MAPPAVVTVVRAMSRMATRLPWFVGSSATDDIAVTKLSFYMSRSKKVSKPNSTNSHRTPMVIEKQNATIAT